MRFLFEGENNRLGERNVRRRLVTVLQLNMWHFEREFVRRGRRDARTIDENHTLQMVTILPKVLQAFVGDQRTEREIDFVEIFTNAG